MLAYVGVDVMNCSGVVTTFFDAVVEREKKEVLAPAIDAGPRLLPLAADRPPRCEALQPPAGGPRSPPPRSRRPA